MAEATEIETLASVVRAGLDADEQILKGVSVGPHYPEKWTAVERSYSDIRRWHVDGQCSNVASGMFAGDAAHIERHDPAAILARVARDRAMVDLLLAEPHASSCPSWRDDPDEWPCECNRDRRVTAYLTLLAEPYGATSA